MSGKNQREIKSAEDVTEEILEQAESVFDGWYIYSNRVDWTDFFERLESRCDADFGADWQSPAIKKVKSHIAKYRKL